MLQECSTISAEVGAALSHRDVQSGSHHEASYESGSGYGITR